MLAIISVITAAAYGVLALIKFSDGVMVTGYMYTLISLIFLCVFLKSR